MDNETVKRAFKEADLIIFVSDIQNGGLNAAEAEYLNTLKDILGGLSNLKNQTLFVMSKLDQIDDDQVQKVVDEHSKNIQSALGFSPENICVYDAVTYEEGKKSNSTELVKISGMDELKAEIERRSKVVLSERAQYRDERLEVK